MDAAAAHLSRTVPQVQQVRAADLLAAQREPVLWEVVGRDLLRGQLGPMFDAVRTAAKLLRPLKR